MNWLCSTAILSNRIQPRTTAKKISLDVRRNHDEAERLYRKALELDPKDANIIGGFAVFMYLIRKNNNEVERLCRKALMLDPKHANNNANFAFLIGKNSKTMMKQSGFIVEHLNLDSKTHSTPTTLRSSWKKLEKIFLKPIAFFFWR